MKWLKEQLEVWPIWAMILIVIISGFVFGIKSCQADETVTTKGTTEKGYVRLKSTTNTDGVTTTRGTINGKYVRTKTRNGVTTGTVDGKSVRLKTKKVSKDFKPDW